MLLVGIYWIVEDIIILKGSFINVVYDFSFASFWCDSVTRFWYIELLLPLYILYLLVYKCFDTEKKMAFRRLMIIISGSVLLITIVWFFGKDTYENIEIVCGGSQFFWQAHIWESLSMPGMSLTEVMESSML
ncbi:hypothetical protein DWY25_03295 [Holdemania filiformis]|uniref:Uncharacterized protein n=1 Tax=Holdemania filiformis TaxID=61171 RepID=A0A412G5U5_9FIRM|nr:hypothetical protein DWY25_03295 [Holdemania filiformis]